MKPSVRSILSAVLGLSALTAAIPAASAEESGFPYIWSQYGPKGERIVRVVLDQGKPCPTIDMEDGKKIEMHRRLPANQVAFPVTVCSAGLWDAHAPATVLGEALPPLPRFVDRIVVVGDTGCRVAKGWTQDCNDPDNPNPAKGWPFKRIAALIDKAEKDIILHVGDYHYREFPCAEGEKKCAGTVYGDNWESWRQDWFDPARPILGDAPWVFVRGNHENCKRAPQGWFLFMGHGKPDEAFKRCDRYTDGYLTPIGADLEFAVMDSSQRRKPVVDVANCRAWMAQTAELLDTPPAPGRRRWAITHEPVYWWYSEGDNASVREDPCKGKKFDPAGYVRWYADDRIKAGEKLTYGTVLSGDIHIWQWTKSKLPGWPTQITAGNGATQLDTVEYWPSIYEWPVGIHTDGAPYTGGGWWTMEVVFGIVELERIGDGTDWLHRMIDVNGALRQFCVLGDTKAAAQAAKSAGLDGEAAAKLAVGGCVRISH